MGCLACARRAVAADGLCRECAAGLVPGGVRRLPGGVLVSSAFAHQGAARLLVHRLKYGAHPAAAGLLASAMAGALSGGAAALVPVPRAYLRRWRYGVDSALELARRLGRLTGLPVVRVLRPSWWHRRRAGARGAPRGTPRFRARAPAPAGAVLVDDVVTTGATLRAAAAALGRPCPAVTATAAPRGGGAPLAAEAIGIVTVKPPSGMPTTGACVPAGAHCRKDRSRSPSACLPRRAPGPGKGGHGGASSPR